MSETHFKRNRLFVMNQHHDWQGFCQAIVLNIATFAISYTNVERVLKIILILVSIGYTSYKFYSDYQKNKTK